ncbi:hypothetical protein ACGRHY_25085 [Streptomyces sp. HK10]|uniref:hypothetical protein n=1 Tax=Streptomyces sp. HK10 TaxID=3373255 RepID=UPI00374873D6
MPSAETDSLMEDLGAKPSRPGCWTGPPEVILSAAAALRERNERYYVMYDFFPESSDSSHGYAAQLGLICADDVDLEEDPPMICETEDEEAVLANGALIDLLDPITQQVDWSARNRGKFRELAHAPRIPDPVTLSGAYGFDQGATGLWMVSHDGRMTLTERNLDFLEECGIAWAEAYEVAGRIYPVAPFLVFSGRVTETLTAHRVEFSGNPIYMVSKQVSDTAQIGDGGGQS